MKSQLLALSLILLVAFGVYHSGSVQGSQSFRFEEWCSKHSKVYSEGEKAYRRGIWSKNEKFVLEHNLKFIAGVQSYDLQMNLFSDLTEEQFGERYLMKDVTFGATGKCTGAQAPTANLPDEWDWSQKGAVTPIKNQGQCGSCWAFSSTGSLEGALHRMNGTLASFSEQQLVDCSHAYGNNGCGGGFMNQSFFYVIDNGIALESKYPYKGVGEKCNYNANTDKAWQIKDCTEVTVDKEINLQAAVALNPVSVAIEANHISFQLYKSGVYSGNCGTKLDHGVLAVGYGSASGKKYWKVKNSWGPSWGMKGYINIENTGDGKGKCGIQMAASYPLY